MWVLDHRRDLDADFAAVYGVADMEALPGPQFFARAYRLPAYTSVMATRLTALDGRPPASQVPAVELTSRAAVASIPGAAGLFEFGVAS